MLKKGLLTAAVAAATLAAGASAAIDPSVARYAVPLVPEYDTVRLLSVGDTVPETSDPAREYRMVGLPDGLGAHENPDGTVSVYMNHELGSSVVAEPFVGGPASRGSYVSVWRLDTDGNVLSGDRAYDSVYVEETYVGPAADATNATRGFDRFCSGFLVGPEHGFDRYVYLAGEESDGSSTFDGLGGLSVAIYDGEAHALPRLGRFAKENTVVQAKPGNRTVIFPMEDGPSTPDSQLWMYVGKKDRSRDADPLSRNGLDNGDLYVFRSLDPDANSELGFQSGSVAGEWVRIPGAQDMSAAELEAAADAVGAMTFIRPEDGAFNPNNANELLFVTTGGNAAEGNELGRLYSLRLHPGNPTKPAQLTVVYNADSIVAAGGDVALSPDNVDASRDYLMVQEDGTTESRAVMAAKGRDGSVWRFELGAGSVGVDAASATRVVELDPPGRDGVAVGPGVWETSGIIKTSRLFGAGTWLFDVQAHRPTTAPVAGTVEDGQLLLLVPNA